MCRSRRLICWSLGVTLVCAALIPADGQVIRRVVRNGMVVEEGQGEQHDGFSVRKEGPKFNDALEDFERYRDKKAWELAFRSLEQLAEGKREGMVPAGDGFFVPSAQRILRALTSLPPDGKQAFRLFYDARAKQLLEQVEAAVKGQATAGATGGAAAEALAFDEIAALREIHDRYFITSVGDRAADRLGDALFESGDFAAAAMAWATVLDHAPDTTLSRPRLYVKRGLALARAGQWDVFDETLRAVRSEFAGERVTVGGREVVASEFLESLRPAANADPGVTAAAAGPDGPRGVEAAVPVELPTDDKPAWQITFLDQSLEQKLEGALTSNGWGRHMTGLSTVVPDAATDGRHVYANWLGIVFAADVRTGKLVWRNRKFSELGERFQFFVNSLVNVDCYSLTAAGDRLFVTGINLDRLQHYQESVRLVCMTAADGKVKWSSNNSGLANWSFVGRPVLAGDLVYATGRNPQGADLVLLAIGADKGELRWQLPLGTAQGGQTFRGEPDVPSPVLLPHGAGQLYVLTNNGALLAVDAGSRRVMWAYTYAPPPVMNREMFWSGNPAAPRPTMRPAAFVHGSTLYLKEYEGDALHAIDLTGPSLRWRRPLDRENTIARLPDGRLLSVGQDLGAIDPESRALRWSASLPALATRIAPVVGTDRLLAFAPRGIYEIDLADGDTVRIFRGADRDSLGGTLCRAPGRLISVSNRAITAYPTTHAWPLIPGEPGQEGLIGPPDLNPGAAPAGEE